MGFAGGRHDHMAAALGLMSVTIAAHSARADQEAVRVMLDACLSFMEAGTVENGALEAFEGWDVVTMDSGTECPEVEGCLRHLATRRQGEKRLHVEAATLPAAGFAGRDRGRFPLGSAACLVIDQSLHSPPSGRLVADRHAAIMQFEDGVTTAGRMVTAPPRGDRLAGTYGCDALGRVFELLDEPFTNTGFVTTDATFAPLTCDSATS